MEDEQVLEIPRSILIAGFGVIAVFVFLIFNPIAIVGAGERGVLLKWSAVQEEIYDEGFHWRIPIYEKVIKMDVKTQRMEGHASAASKDLQDVAATVVLNYHLDVSHVQHTYQTLRKDYEARVIDPSIQEAVKAVTAQYNAEELITQRPRVKSDIRERLTEKLGGYNIIVEDISITNFQFSESYTHAIEEKQVAEQEALKAVRVLERKVVEAQQVVVMAEAEKQRTILEAEGRAEALRLQKVEITPELNKYKAIEKWDGTMPMYMGGGIVPFIELDTTVASVDSN